jgi:response regulator NasT
MSDAVTEHLRVLVAHESGRAAARVAALGHDVVVGDIASIEVSAVAANGWPDMAIVEVGQGAGPALELVERLARAAAFPVVVVTDEADPALDREAAARGAFACVTHDDPRSWQGTIEFVARRFGDYRRLATAFERRAVIERAKGIMMERHTVDESSAFEALRQHARNANRRLVDVSTHITESHALLAGAAPLARPRN